MLWARQRREYGEGGRVENLTRHQGSPMVKLGIFASVSVFVGAITFAHLSAPSAQTADGCKQTTFKTVMVKEACAKGGQKAAKDAMKKWAKAKGIKSCNQCHRKLAPTYDLKPDGLDQFVKAGGELVDAKKPVKKAK
jgi:hypothetical protein